MATLTAATCAYTDVNGAISSATTNDTVFVPSGTATWTNQLTIGKGIYLVSSGTTLVNGGATYLIRYEPDSYVLNQNFRLTGFSFDANGYKILSLGASAKAAPFSLQTNVRIDHNTFTRSTGTHQKGQAIWNNGTIYGLVDNNVFTQMGYPVAHSFGVDDDDWWENEPQNTFELGSQYYLYWEDNSFTIVSGGASLLTDGEYSARYVFRYNTINTEDTDTYSLFDLHGEQDTPMPASFGVEIYGNEITHGVQDLCLFAQRSGQCMVFLNNAKGSTTPWIKAYTSAACTCPAAYCSDKITHNTYWFRNRRNDNGVIFTTNATGVVTGGLDCCGLTDIPTAGRDVFLENTTPAVTLGTLANRPSTCAIGQGYWATDQDTTDISAYTGANPSTTISGTLYICQTTDVWTEFYTPYTYPHPLRTTVAGNATKGRLYFF